MAVWEILWIPSWIPQAPEAVTRKVKESESTALFQIRKDGVKERKEVESPQLQVVHCQCLTDLNVRRKDFNNAEEMNWRSNKAITGIAIKGNQERTSTPVRRIAFQWLRKIKGRWYSGGGRSRILLYLALWMLNSTNHFGAGEHPSPVLIPVLTFTNPYFC